MNNDHLSDPSSNMEIQEQEELTGEKSAVNLLKEAQVVLLQEPEEQIQEKQQITGDRTEIDQKKEGEEVDQKKEEEEIDQKKEEEEVDQGEEEEEIEQKKEEEKVDQKKDEEEVDQEEEVEQKKEEEEVNQKNEEEAVEQRKENEEVDQEKENEEVDQGKEEEKQGKKEEVDTESKEEEQLEATYDKEEELVNERKKQEEQGKEEGEQTNGINQQEEELANQEQEENKSKEVISRKDEAKLEVNDNRKETDSSLTALRREPKSNNNNNNNTDINIKSIKGFFEKTNEDTNGGYDLEGKTLNSEKEQRRSNMADTTKTSRFGGNIEKCAQCNRTVYAMEKMEVAGRVMHKTCFRCCKCNSPLNVGRFSVGGGLLYCLTHYKQAFREKGTYDVFTPDNPCKGKWENKTAAE